MKVAIRQYITSAIKNQYMVLWEHFLLITAAYEKYARYIIIEK